MKALDFIPAVLFGALLGALVALAVRDPQSLSSNAVPSFITAATTIVVGWWIHTAVRRRGELDRIPIDYVFNLNRRIDELISACVSTGGDERLTNFRRLGIDVGWLLSIARRARAGSAELESDLAMHYFDFKKCLTDREPGDAGSVSRMSNELRMAALQVQWRISQRILGRGTHSDVFAVD